MNVPSIGDRTIDQTGIAAPDAAAAIQIAKDNIRMRATQIQETAP